MFADTVRRFLRRRPFEPLRIKMKNGAAFEVRHPEMARLTKAGLIVARHDSSGGPSDHIEFCSFLRIASVETAAIS